MAARNAGAANKRPMIFRIGVHLGDVIVEGDDIYGDGVNIAARLEGIAEPGGICISRQAYDQVQKKLALGYRSLGPQNLKNIPDPVEAFAIKGDGLAAADDKQEIRYCRAPDGVRLAYAISGQRPAARENRELAEPPGIRLAKPDLAPFSDAGYRRITR